MWKSKRVHCSWLKIVICIAVIGTFSVFLDIVPVAMYDSSPSSSSGMFNSSKSSQISNSIFRGAHWKPQIAAWLNSCHHYTVPVSISERLYSDACENNCGGNGVCNRELGECRCFHGYKGKSCQEYEFFECNNPAVEDWPYGVWRVSMCSAFCDKKRAMCFCGEGSAYPNRPLPESCGFVLNGTQVDWAKNDFETVYAGANSSVGWCNVKPEDHYSGKVQLKPHCDCKYDCNWGLLCETPTECTCFNQCSGNGVCRGGFCQCESSWYGLDCSIPSVKAPLSDWPDWLRPASLNIPEHNTNSTLQDVYVEKMRPLIYVYDLPPIYNSHLMEGRHFKFECVNRVYDGANATFWSENLYGSEMALLESILASPHRTMNGDEADFFYVPVLGACAITRADDTPHLAMDKHGGLRGYFSGDLYIGAYMHIKENYPYWNRSNGRDHIWFFPWDEGACPAPKEIWNSTMLVHWGNTNSKHKTSTTGYWGDNWDPIPTEWRGTHPCYDPTKDIVLPAWKVPDPRSIADKLWARPREERKYLFYFNGNLGNAYGGRPEDRYSMGIRQKVAREFGSIPNKEGKLGRQAAPDVIVASQRSEDYAGDLSNSRFCGVFPGDGWSGRMEDAILHGCIPVIIQDGIYLPYENVLDYQSFTVRISEDNISKMINVLRNMSDVEVDAKLSAVRGIWERFLYKDSVLMEARRQQKNWNHYVEWAQKYDTLSGDDVTSTLIQILHYKLHNDKWREELNSKKAWGVRSTCIKKSNRTGKLQLD